MNISALNEAIILLPSAPRTECGEAGKFQLNCCGPIKKERFLK